jgi:hypothetical protein
VSEDGIYGNEGQSRLTALSAGLQFEALYQVFGCAGVIRSIIQAADRQVSFLQFHNFIAHTHS